MQPFVKIVWPLFTIIGRARSFPLQILPNSAAPFARLEFRSSQRPPILEYTVPTLAQLYTYK